MAWVAFIVLLSYSHSPLMSADTAAAGAEQEQSVTPLELFFDLVFVFAFTQVSSFLAHHLTWTGLAQGAALLGVLWWAWVCYSWSTGVVDTEEEMPARLVVLVAMAGMLLVALAVPDAFEGSAILFGVAYFVVRVLHVVHYVITGPTEAQEAILRVAPGFLGGPALLVIAGFFEGTMQAILWVLAIVIDYGIVYIRGVEGFTVHVGHFVERHRLIMIIALGESIVAIGIGAEELTFPVIGAALLGIVLVIALWWLYFDYVVLAAEGRLGKESGTEQTILARDSYSYLHLFIVGSIVFIALGIEQTIAHVSDPLGVIPAVAFCGGCGLYLFGHNAFRYRDHRTVSYLRLTVGVVAIVLIPVALAVPALVTLSLLTALLAGLALYETIWSDHRNRLRSGRVKRDT